MTATNEILELKARAQRADRALAEAQARYSQAEETAESARQDLIEMGLDPDGDLEAQLEELRAGIEDLLTEIEGGLNDE